VGAWDADDFRPHQVHHILGGSRRIDAVPNFLFVCAACHELIHASEIRLAIVMTLKKESDPEWDRPWLVTHYAPRLLPWCAQVSDGIHLMRRRWDR
jgi:hypothetical protein